MDTFLSLLLLACCVSAAQFNTESDNEVSSHLLQTESKGEEAAQTSNNQQSWPTDIHAVLMEMSEKLAELKYEISSLQRENEAQAGELVTIKARTTITENHVDTLRREGEGKKVAFSASLWASGHGYHGPFNTFTSLVFRNVVTNIGNAYNSNTGIFTAPVRGAYHFEMHIHGHGHPSYSSGAVLVKNRHRIFIAYGYQSSNSVKASNSVTLLLEVGDVVFLQLWPHTRIYDNQNHHTTFSGHLLYMM